MALKNIRAVVNKAAFAVMVVLGTAIASTTPAFAQAQEARRVPAMSLEVHKKTQEVQELVDIKDYEAAKSLADTVITDPATNNYEKAVLWQMKAAIAFTLNDKPATIDAYLHILEYRDNIPPNIETQILYAVSQLYFTEANYDAALTYYEAWQKTIPGPVAAANMRYLAQVYYALKNYRATIDAAEKALPGHEKTTAHGNITNLYSMIISSYHELGDTENTRSALARVIDKGYNTPYCKLYAALLYQNTASIEQAELNTQNSFQACADFKADADLPDTSFREVATARAPIKITRKQNLNTENYLPVVPTQPQYPSAAVEQKINGHVIVSMTVLADGTIDPASIKIIESVPEGVFDEVSVKAASGFRYAPKVMDGKAQDIKNVRYKFTFNIAE
ncbi:energy transducer TonB [Kordiimonas pumila]|uniref:TonB family protein n=1 Tax=Kordiimonas pumila TaxID=2161677 RepID=A0ABV7D647_9PROT|nr:energy transducer TonB [Kordiimonas pumila]